MAESLNLADPESVAMHRMALLTDLPTILEVAGAYDQVNYLRQGQHQKVVDWFLQTVSIGNHGIAEGGLGLTRIQTAEFNPLAQRNGLITPTAQLWTTEDTRPDGVLVGEIKDYSVEPNYDELSPEIYQSNTAVVVGATFSGMIGRIDTALGVVKRSEGVKRGESGKLVILTGMRPTPPSEGNNGLYKAFLPEDFDSTTPIEQAFPSEADSALGILQKRIANLRLIHQIDDTEANNKPLDHQHPLLGSRTWIARTYIGEVDDVSLEATIVNGEPIPPNIAF